MSAQDLNELPTTYNPQEAENKWYDVWQKKGHFKPKKGKANKTYTIIMPPPNVTGQLHMGHALDVTTQDALIRFKRMKGFETLYLPGMDHAGISTQAVVEKMVWEKEKKTRHDYGREEFIKKIWQWKEQYGGIIANQQKSLGASCDWDYFTFTLDEIPNAAVKKVFVDWYNQKLIYQDDRLINWDPVLQSAISDAEVEHQEVQGAFYHIHYKIKGEEVNLEVATTRPETMLGDSAVAVHPEDPRWNKYIGKTAIVPICNREVPIIGDSYVDMEKGTGCLKVTPGHDFNDFEIGKRHKLDLINILNLDGTLNQNAQDYQGLTCKKARKQIVDKLKELGLLVDEKKHVHQVGHGDRSKAVIEPMLSRQWFLNVQEMAKMAVDAVKTDKTKFWPKGWENTYFSWLNEPKDWCISRQLWWGHQIPVFTCQDCQHQWASEDTPTSCPQCQKSKIQQDPDVLDTWFSSGLWPFSTLGWPHKKAMQEKGFDRFYPTQTLVTGYDIIFFWVARMMMMGLQTTKQVPFSDVYIHAIVRDKQGRKMSKSLGNGIDPIEMQNKYGADAIRFTLAAGSGYNRNLNLDPERIEGNRNFMNKIWNAFRFVAPHLVGHEAQKLDLATLSKHEKWILGELNQTIKNVNESMEEYRFDDSCQAIYSFVYDKFCSWFIEMSKNILYHGAHDEKKRRVSVLHYCFGQILRLLHPFTPYITEELWQYIKGPQDNLLISCDFPEASCDLVFTAEQEDMEKFIETVTAIRNLRASVNIKPKDEIEAHFFSDDQDINALFSNELSELKKLAGVKSIQVHAKNADRPAKAIFWASSYTEVFVPLEGVIDLSEQIKRLEKELAKAKADLQKAQAKLSNQNFVANAPPQVIEEAQKTQADAELKVQSIERNIDRFR